MNASSSPIVGIDLGTTNSVVAAIVKGEIRVLEEDGEAILPSVVGMTADGRLIVGQAAKNQLAVFPDRTIASVKRRMGQAVKLPLGDQEFSPQEISAMILRRLRQRAEKALGVEVSRAVITVPAFFDEDQRQATREAGILAGFTVERIINEPTAASLVYHSDSPKRRHLIVYDLGGGTFDVSIVRIESGVVEVLSSKGDTRLGGDDFDMLLSRHVAALFRKKHGVDLLDQPATRWRVLQACERAKCELSTLGVVRIAEEFIATVDGAPAHLDVEIGRREYEGLIAPLVERTIACVDQAIRDSGLELSQLDELIAVGGSTRTPLVLERLREEFHRDPKWSVSPDLAVALGAATQGAMQSGHSIGPVLIDVATHSLGIEALDRNSYGSEDLCYFRILNRNAPLPAKFEDVFRTVQEKQAAAVIRVYQGESDQLSQNRLIGALRLEGLNAVADHDGRILVRFELTLDGLLKVSATERKSGISKTVKISNALSEAGEVGAEARERRLESLFDASEGFQAFSPGERRPFDAELDDDSDAEGDENGAPESDSRTIEASGVWASVETGAGDAVTGANAVSRPKLQQLVARARNLRSSLAADDAADVDRLVAQIAAAEGSGDVDQLDSLETELDDLLFYLSE